MHFWAFPRTILCMDSHEKLGNLLSDYLSSSQSEKQVPSDVLNAFHLLGLSEFASRENVDETYRTKCNNAETELLNSGNSRFSKEFYNQQKKELSDAYTLITGWLDTELIQ